MVSKVVQIFSSSKWRPKLFLNSLKDEIDDMNESMLRLKRLATKEGANLEYLKNVTLTYMLSTDFRSKEHMLKAIGMLLMM